MTNYYWLNDDSRLFLERGYLKKGETPERRIRDIAETAEVYLGIDGFADKFEGYMKQGFYSLASPVWSNFGRDRGLPISCNGVYVLLLTLVIFASVAHQLILVVSLLGQSILWNYLIRLLLLFLRVMFVVALSQLTSLLNILT